MGVFRYLKQKITMMGTYNHIKTYIILKIHFKSFPMMYNTSHMIKAISTYDFFHA